MEDNEVRKYRGQQYKKYEKGQRVIYKESKR